MVWVENQQVSACAPNAGDERVDTPQTRSARHAAGLRSPAEGALHRPGARPADSTTAAFDLL